LGKELSEPITGRGKPAWKQRAFFEGRVNEKKANYQQGLGKKRAEERGC
jgi:hypothetical protein